MKYKKIGILLFLPFFVACNPTAPDQNKNLLKDSIDIELAGTPMHSNVSAFTTHISQPELDSSFLLIKLFDNNSFRVIYLKDSFDTRNVRKIDRLFRKHKKQLTAEKIVVVGNPDARYARFKEIKDVIKKYEFYRFRIYTDSSLH